jgi:RND family efflux transporter MFP subunit
VEVAAEVTGRLVNLPISDNQLVTKGDLLLEIDPVDYQLQVAMAKSQLEYLKAQRDLAQIQYDRRQALLKSASIAQEDRDVALTNLKALDDQIKQSQAALDKAQLDLKITRVYAETDGYITNLNLRTGNMIAAGQPLVALVDKNSFYVIGYFEETKRPYIETGKKVEIHPYDGSPKIGGQINGYGRAIVDQSATTGSQMIQNVQPNYPWVTLAQRIPVRITLDQEQLKAREKDLIAGSTCTIVILD